MSIELQVENYCHKCPDFEPRVVKDNITFYKQEDNYTNTRIFCSHHNRCAAIKRYLESEEKKNVRIC